MRSILPLIQLLFALVPLSCVRVSPKTPKFTCKKAVKVLEGQDEFQRRNEVSVNPESPISSFALPCSCLNNDEALDESDNHLIYKIQDNNGAHYLLNLNWDKDINDPKMAQFRELARILFEMPEHPNLLNMKKFLKNKVDEDSNPVVDDGNPVNDDSTENPTEAWFVYYALMEHPQHGTLRNLLVNNPEYTNNAPWVGYTLFKITKAVMHLHVFNNIHTDIDLENVVLDENLEPKLVVLLIPVKRGTSGSLRGNICLVAPEVLAIGNICGKKSAFTWSLKQDAFLIGVLLYQMFDPNKLPFGCGDLPNYDTENPIRAGDSWIPSEENKELIKKQFETIKNGKFQVRGGLPFWAISAIQGLLRFDEGIRWGDFEILQAFGGFSTTPGNLKIFQAPATGSRLTMYTPIEIPRSRSDQYITITAESNFKGLKAFEVQDPKVLENFDPKDPSFLYLPKLVSRFTLVR